MHQRSMNCKVAERNEQVHQEIRPEIMESLLHDAFLWLGFSSKAAKLIITDKGWMVTGVHEDTVCLPTGQKRLKYEHKDLNMMPKVDKADMAGSFEAIQEYLIRFTCTHMCSWW